MSTTHPQSFLLKAFLEHKNTLAAFLAQKMLKPEDVDDILQETFSLALEQGKKQAIQSPKSYLFIIARNLMSKQLKAQALSMEREIEDVDLHKVPSEEASVEQQIDTKKLLEAFQANVKALPPQCRKVFLMRKLFGWPHKRIAAHFGISTSTVERHITIALSRLDKVRNNQFDQSEKAGSKITPIQQQTR